METVLEPKPKRVLKKCQLDNLQRGREARMKKLQDRKQTVPSGMSHVVEQVGAPIQATNEDNQTVIPPSSAPIVLPEETPIIIERTKPVKPKKQETPVEVSPVQETPTVQTPTEQETPETPNTRRKRLAREQYKKNKIIKRKTPVIKSKSTHTA